MRLMCTLCFVLYVPAASAQQESLQKLAFDAPCSAMLLAQDKPAVLAQEIVEIYTAFVTGVEATGTNRSKIWSLYRAKCQSAPKATVGATMRSALAGQ